MILKLIQLWFVSFIHGFFYSTESWHKLMLHKSAVCQEETMLWFRAHWLPCRAASQGSAPVKAGLWLVLSPISVSPPWNCICGLTCYFELPPKSWNAGAEPQLSLAAPEFKGNHPQKFMAVFICSWLIPDCLTTSLMPSAMTAKNTSLFSECCISQVNIWNRFKYMSLPTFNLFRTKSHVYYVKRKIN